MASTTTNEMAVRATMDALIKAGTSFDMDALDRIYHDELKVITIDWTGALNHADKAAFKGLFGAKKAAGEPPLNTWARYNHVDAGDGTAHVLVTRKVKLGDEEQKLILSIDLVHEEDRWQVTREVIFASAE